MILQMTENTKNVKLEPRVSMTDLPVLGELWHLHGHLQLQAPRALQHKDRMAGLRERLLEGAQALAIVSVEVDQAALWEVQQSADASRNVHHKDVWLHIVVEQLEPAAAVSEKNEGQKWWHEELDSHNKHISYRPN